MDACYSFLLDLNSSQPFYCRHGKSYFGGYGVVPSRAHNPHSSLPRPHIDPSLFPTIVHPVPPHFWLKMAPRDPLRLAKTQGYDLLPAQLPITRAVPPP